MQTKYKNHSKTLLLSLLFLIIPVVIWGLWIYVFENNPNASQPEKVKLYLSYLPGFLQSNFNVSIVVLIACLVAIVLAAVSLIKSPPIVKSTGIIIIIVSSLVLLLQLFSMM